ncbi:MAG: non-heme iron oxygenase ferredoxin subunit [Gammaproteobacteria bacterium]
MSAGDGWQRLAAADDMPATGHASFEVDGKFIAVYAVQGEHYAIEDVCTHDGEPLADAPIEPATTEDMAMGGAGPVVVCPRHGARFCLRTGAVLCPPAYEPVRTFDLRLEADAWWIRLGT